MLMVSSFETIELNLKVVSNQYVPSSWKLQLDRFKFIMYGILETPANISESL